MSLTISDEVLKAMKMDDREARIEIACRLFDAEKLGKAQAGRMAGLSRDEFEAELIKRDLPVIRYTEEHWRQDVAALEKMDRDRLEHAQKQGTPEKQS
jgi:predicted HTH domain antitoxin